MYFNWLIYIFLFLYILYILVEVLLEFLNIKSIAQSQYKVSIVFKKYICFNKYQKSIKYTKEKTYFKVVVFVYQSLFLWSLFFNNFFRIINNIIEKYFSEHLFSISIMYPFFIGFTFYVSNLPFKIYFHFFLEEKFGFNKITIKTFIIDQIKVFILSLSLGLPVISLIFLLIEYMGIFWWFMSSIFIVFFQLFIIGVYPVLFAPLFYGMIPLNNMFLKNKLVKLLKDVNLRILNIFVTDGSKRSLNSNAYFFGLGKTRRIILFDILLKSLTINETISILAHEIGHSKKKHIQKNLILSYIMVFFLFSLFSFCLEWDLFFISFGIDEPIIHIGFVLFFLFYSILIFPFIPIVNMLSRKYEFEADQFAILVVKDKVNIITALIKLSKNNMSNLTPHPWYSFYHYTHPVITERVDFIYKINDS